MPVGCPAFARLNTGHCTDFRTPLSRMFVGQPGTTIINNGAPVERFKPMPQSCIQWQFLSGLDTSYARSTRAHVLQRHLRERRLRAARKARRDSEGEQGLMLTNQELSSSLRDQNTPSQQPSHTKSQGFGSAVAPQNLSFLGQGRVDPFQTFARKVHGLEMLIIDSCV
jgi:hypothetical protein